MIFRDNLTEFVVQFLKKGLSIFCIGVCSLCGAQNIFQAEYFFDTDPGPGNGTPLSFAPGDPVTFTETVSTTGLSPGYHFLFVRTKTSSGNWSLFEGQRFFVDGGIIAAEYFFDVDPGIGNGTALSVTGSSTITPTISTAGLSDGDHYLFIRTKHDGDIWSISDPRHFHIQVRIVEAEYFIDSDPGFGNGMPLTISTPTNLISITPTITTPMSLLNGDHYLFVRTKDILGKWSFIEPQLFTVDSSLPVELLDFTATPTREGRVKLQWTTTTETNNDFFTIEHATSAIEFNEISQVPGAGTSTRSIDYESIHNNPVLGTNYYRLRQTDFDGTYTYSKIISADVTTLRPTTVYPNPIKDRWFVEFPTEDETRLLEIFDLSGKKVMEYTSQGERVAELNRNGISGGSYVLRIAAAGLPADYLKINFR